ncbi:uncharacterized protein LOC141509733 [Macrotis lagotis]|uniref:uncharacterized protein LOC141509733 n=1 Tax=Macrotis lagotis TaxID=92651 RepID=UPI003D692F74
MGQAEVCQVTLILSLALSVPLVLSLPAQCTGFLSGSMTQAMPMFTSLICLILGVTELLTFVFFLMLLNHFKFLLKDFSIRLNWPPCLLLISAVVYIAVGTFIFYHHLNFSTSLIQPVGKQLVSQSSVVQHISKTSQTTEQSEALQKKPPKLSRTHGLLWIPRTKLLTSGNNPQLWNQKHPFSKTSSRFWGYEKPWLSQHTKTSSYPLGFRVQSIFMNSPSPTDPPRSQSPNFKETAL